MDLQKSKDLKDYILHQSTRRGIEAQLDRIDQEHIFLEKQIEEFRANLKEKEKKILQSQRFRLFKGKKEKISPHPQVIYDKALEDFNLLERQVESLNRQEENLRKELQLYPDVSKVIDKMIVKKRYDFRENPIFSRKMRIFDMQESRIEREQAKIKDDLKKYNSFDMKAFSRIYEHVEDQNSAPYGWSGESVMPNFAKRKFLQRTDDFFKIEIKKIESDPSLVFSKNILSAIQTLYSSMMRQSAQDASIFPTIRKVKRYTEDWKMHIEEKKNALECSLTKMKDRFYHLDQERRYYIIEFE